MKIICIGAATQDIFFPTTEGKIVETPDDMTCQKKIYFELGGKYHVSDRFESLGGCAVNQACALKRLGIQAGCYTVFGNDMVGEWLKKNLQKEGVDYSLSQDEVCPSGMSAIVVDEGSGDRVIFSNQEANERLKVEAEKLKAAEWISVSDPNGDWKKTVAQIFEIAQANNSKIAYNPRGTNIKENSKLVLDFAGRSELFFVNKDEAIEILNNNQQLATDNLNDEEFLLGELKKSGAKIVVITDGPRGVWATDGEKIIHADALTERPVDMTGAGDAFASAFLAAHIKGKRLEECLQWGTKNGGNVVKFYGGVEGLLTESEIEK